MTVRVVTTVTETFFCDLCSRQGRLDLVDWTRIDPLDFCPGCLVFGACVSCGERKGLWAKNCRECWRKAMIPARGKCEARSHWQSFAYTDDGKVVHPHGYEPCNERPGHPGPHHCPHCDRPWLGGRGGWELTRDLRRKMGFPPSG